jgi:integrase/recombinase XerD
MTTAPVPVPRATSPASLTDDQFQTLASIPPELEWFANLTNANTRRAYQ